MFGRKKTNPTPPADRPDMADFNSLQRQINNMSDRLDARARYGGDAPLATTPVYTMKLPPAITYKTTNPTPSWSGLRVRTETCAASYWQAQRERRFEELSKMNRDLAVSRELCGNYLRELEQLRAKQRPSSIVLEIMLADAKDEAQHWEKVAAERGERLTTVMKDLRARNEAQYRKIMELRTENRQLVLENMRQQGYCI